MPSSDSSKSSSSSNKNQKKNNKKKKKSSDKDKATKKKKKSNDKKNNNDKPSSIPFSWLPSNARNALSPPRKGDNNNTKVIAIGAAIGAMLFLFFIIACMVCCCCCRKKKKQHKHDKSYSNHGEIKDNGYYNKQQHDWNQHQVQSNDLHLKMPPQPRSGPPSSEHWVAAPPPPPPGMMPPPPGMMSSSDISSSSYSGPYQPPLPPPHPGIPLSVNTNSFTYDELAAATKGFDNSLLLGQGGFGYVHKGVLPNGKDVAVKSLKVDSGQGEREFQAEVEIISRVHHRHLVSLVGYCMAGQQRILVFEFIPNKTLEHHIHGSVGKGSPVVDCSTRLQIALGAAKGFAYLHEDCDPRIIHRDIKAANILLDDLYEAKVADFGLAKLSSETITHVSTRIMGTFGYLAPEYASTGKLTEKSDVFSFGVVLLELITGRRPINRQSDDDNLIDWARPILMHASNGGSFEELVDPRLGDNYNREEMHSMVACAASAIKHSARIRPKMRQIVRVLEGDTSLDNLVDTGKNV